MLNELLFNKKNNNSIKEYRALNMTTNTQKPSQPIFSLVSSNCMFIIQHHASYKGYIYDEKQVKK